ncbi:hypothetical protein DEU56DRAFT_246081, partial [Suillus clintonianus]|uniref:uncharacterized protein n=1 Tax=Suillus clintonianus TaxID=1904413 RepID=UPI001B8764BF
MQTVNSNANLSPASGVIAAVQIITLKPPMFQGMITQSMCLHQGLVSGLGHLPTEIIIHIFHHCLPESNYPSALKAPLLLTAVCRRWREAAVDIPSLWLLATVSRVYNQPSSSSVERAHTIYFTQTRWTLNHWSP